MGNVYAMNKKKEELVKKRQQRITEACDNLEKKGVRVTYESVSIETIIPGIDDKGIPSKTLEKEHYSKIIDRYRVTNKNGLRVNEVDRYEEEINYLKRIIIGLRQQNKELKTELLSAGKI